MEEVTESAGNPVTGRWMGRADAAWLALLLLIAAALHAWLVWHTEVIARDTIGFIHYAWALERTPWAEALPRIHQHPLYPVTVLGLSLPVRWLAGDTARAMILSSQLVSAIAGVLLVMPMFFLGRELFGRRVAFWGCLLFQCLPVCAQITSDGLSDGLFLLMVMTSLLLAFWGVERRSVLSLTLSGIASGLAYLARPEGALVALAALLVLLGLQALAGTRWPWRRALRGGVGLLAGAAVMAGPYMLTIGKLTNKPGALQLLNHELPTETLGEVDVLPGTQEAAGPARPFAGGRLFAVWWVDQNRGTPPPLWWGIKTVLAELVHTYHYFAWLPVLLGMWWFRDRFRRPGVNVMLVLAILQGLLLLKVVLGIHYLSERHTLPLAMSGCIWGAAALVWMTDALPGWLGRLRSRPLAPVAASAVAFITLAAAIGWGLPAAMKPLHANRIGHREAGRWLNAHLQANDDVVDPMCWAQFYAGRYRGVEHPPATATRYVVLPNSKNLHAHLSGMDAARELAENGTVVFRWTPTPAQARKYRAEEVVVYAVPASSVPTP